MYLTVHKYMNSKVSRAWSVKHYELPLSLSAPPLSAPTPAKKYSFPRTAFFWHLVPFEVQGDFPFSTLSTLRASRVKAPVFPEEPWEFVQNNPATGRSAPLVTSWHPFLKEALPFCCCFLPDTQGKKMNQRHDAVTAVPDSALSTVP